MACRSSIDCPLQILLHKTPCQRKYPSQRSNNARVAFLGHTDSKNAGEKRNISISPPTRVFYLYINVNCTHPFEIKTWNTKSLRRAAKVVGIWRPFCKLIRVLWNDAPAYEEVWEGSQEGNQVDTVRGPNKDTRQLFRRYWLIQLWMHIALCKWDHLSFLNGIILIKNSRS